MLVVFDVGDDGSNFQPMHSMEESDLFKIRDDDDDNVDEHLEISVILLAEIKIRLLYYSS